MRCVTDKLREGFLCFFCFFKKGKQKKKKKPSEEAGGRSTIVLQLLRGNFFYSFLSGNKLLPQTFLPRPIKDGGGATWEEVATFAALREEIKRAARRRLEKAENELVVFVPALRWAKKAPADTPAAEWAGLRY